MESMGSILHISEHQLADVVDERLIPNRMVVVRFLECEGTLQGIVGKS